MKRRGRCNVRFAPSWVMMRGKAASPRDTSKAGKIAVPVIALCEFVWVLARGYRVGPAEVVRAIRTLIETGLTTRERGGDPPMA